MIDEVGRRGREGGSTIRRAVVTGGLGFIGSHLVETLLSRACEVTVLDNLSTGRRSNVPSDRSSDRLRIVEIDVANTAAVRPYILNSDCVFHLAALADLIPSIEKPLDYFHSNVAGTLGVLEAARAAGVRKFVYAASSSCYGIPSVVPTPENAPVRPEHPYALTKYMAEELVMHWGKVYGLSVVSLRLFNVYGRRVRTNGAYGAVLGVFLAQKQRGQPLTIVGDGTQTRDFTHVTDVAAALVAAAESESEQEILNVGSGHTYAVNDLADLIGGPRVYLPKRPGEPDSTFADISKIQRVLGWAPRMPLEVGVRDLLDHIDEWAEAPLWTPESIGRATAAWFTHLSAVKPDPAMQEVS